LTLSAGEPSDSNAVGDTAIGNRPELITVIIPNLNGAATIGEQLEALAGQTYRGRWEVIVADNGSTDASIEVSRSWMERIPDLRIVDASDRKGSSHARNVAAAVAKGDFLVFCDSDDVVDPGWLEAMSLGAIEFDVVGGWLDDSALNDDVTRQWRRPMRPDRLPIALGFMPYTGAGNCGVRTSTFRELGGWNEGYFIGCMDIDFCWRAGLAGFRVGFAPGAVIQYRWRSDLKGLGRQSFRYGRAEAHLFRDFRKRGMARSKTRKALVGWAWIVVHVFDRWRDPARQGSWTRKAAHAWGRLCGSVRYRVIFL
jgi:GT2 family glycosyltransferase